MVLPGVLQVLPVLFAWLPRACGSGDGLHGRAILTLRQGLRRLQHDEVMSSASNVHVDGTACALNISHLTSLEMKILSTSVPGCDAHRVCQEMLRHGTVELCESDFTYELHHTPNDPFVAEQWGLSMIEAQRAWDFWKGDSGKTIVAIMDTGFDLSHADLRPNLWTNTGEIPGNGVDDDRNGFIDDVHGFDAAHWDGTPDDETGHGTHCAGIVGAAGNNRVGIAGVAHGPKLMGLKFISSSPNTASGSASLALTVMDYGIYNGAKVTSMSFGAYGQAASMKRAIERAQAQNHIVVASAGNDGINNDVTPNYPCAYPLGNLICVAASWTDDSGGLAYFSNYGVNTVDVAAPGHHIKSTYKGGGYAYLQGTSMAAPFVAGLAALLFDRFPSASWKDVRDAIVNTADVSSFGGKVKCGRINARRAMEALVNGKIPRTCNGLVSPKPAPVPQPLPRPVPVPRPTPRPVPGYQPSPRPVPVPQPAPRPAPNPLPASACSFEATQASGLYCGLWRDDSTTKYPWLQYTGSTPSRNTGPSQTAAGRSYLYIETSDPSKPGDLARLKSPALWLRSGAVLSFRYHMYGDHMGTLRVSVFQGTASKILWSRSGQQGNAWHSARVSLGQSGPSQVEVAIEAIRGPGWQSDIAIDGLDLTNYVLSGPAPQPVPVPQPAPRPMPVPRPSPVPQPAPGPAPVLQPTIVCSFEAPKAADGSYCSQWFDDQGDQMDWIRQQGPSPTGGTGPQAAYHGAYYLYLHTYWKWDGDIARLISKPVQLGSGAFLSFRYNMYGATIGTLEVGLLSSTGRRQVFWSKSRDQGQGWHFAKVDVSSGGLDARVFLEASVGSGWYGTGDIAIDSLELQLGGAAPPARPVPVPQPSPGPNPVPSPSGSVLFAVLDAAACAENLPYGSQRISKSSSAFFSTVDADQVHRQWVQKVMPLGSPSSHDIQIEYSFLTSRSLKDRFEVASTVGEPCTWTITYKGRAYTKTGTFWFSDAARLSGKLQSSGSRFSADDGAWGAATGHVNGNCQGQQATGRRKCPSDFWGVMNKNGQDGGCNQLYTGDIGAPVAQSGVRTLMYLVREAPSNPKPPSLPGPGCAPPACFPCGFESDINAVTNTYCNLWRNDRTATTVWTRNFQPTTPSSYTGPNGPAEGQRYLYFEVSSPRTHGDTVRLRSVPVRLSAGATLSFRYHMFGSTVGSLQVTVLEGAVQRTVWQKTGDQGKEWQSAQVKLGDWYADKQVEVSFEGVRGWGWTGDIAIDAVTLDTAGGFATAATRDTAGAITFGLDSSAGQVDVSGLSSIFGALRLQVSPDTADMVQNEEGVSTLQSVLFAIFGRTAEVLGICSAGNTVESQCSSTRLKRNLTSTATNTSTANSSLHVDFRVRIELGSVQDATEVLGELGKIEDGNAESLDEASKELNLAFGGSTMAVLSSPQPVQLQYKRSESAGGQGQPNARVVGGVADEQAKDDSSVIVAVIIGSVGGVAFFAMSALLCLFLVRRRRRNREAGVARKVDPNPEVSVDELGKRAPRREDAKEHFDDQLGVNAKDQLPTERMQKTVEPEDVEACSSRTLLFASGRNTRDAVQEVRVNSRTHCDALSESETPMQPKVQATDFHECVSNESTKLDILESDAASIPSGAGGDRSDLVGEKFAC